MALFAFLDTAEVHHGGLQLLVLLTAVVTVIGALLMLVVARRLRSAHSRNARVQRCCLQLELCAERGRALAVAHHCLRRVRESAHSQR